MYEIEKFGVLKVAKIYKFWQYQYNITKWQSQVIILNSGGSQPSNDETVKEDLDGILPPFNWRSVLWMWQNKKHFEHLQRCWNTYHGYDRIKTDNGKMQTNHHCIHVTR